jgi:hypothetical protein
MNGRLFHIELLCLYGINFKLSNKRKLNRQGIIPGAFCECKTESSYECKMLCTNSYYVSGKEILVCIDCNKHITSGIVKKKKIEPKVIHITRCLNKDMARIILTQLINIEYAESINMKPIYMIT